ncbi:MAG: PQQ-binding-like beta-propeller repeat protein [bacterium]
MGKASRITALTSIAISFFCAFSVSSVSLYIKADQAQALTGQGLDDSPWPCRGHDRRHTGQSQYMGIQSAELKWSCQTGNALDSSPAIGSNGSIYVGSNDGKLYALDPDDGSLKWHYQTGRNIDSSPAIGSDGSVYAGSNNGKLYAFNHNDGSLKWSYQTKGIIHSSPAIGIDGTIYVGSDDYNLYAINSNDGSLKWSYLTKERIRSSPAIGSDGTIYAVSYDGSIYAIKPDKSLKWKRPDIGAHIDSSPAIGSDDTIYVGSDSQYLYALAPNDGSIKWKLLTRGNIQSSPAIGSDGIIYVGSNDGRLYAINPDGSLRWDYPTGNPIHSSPAIGADGTIYVGSSNGNLYALNPGNGSPKWIYPTGKAIDSSPAIGADGSIYVGNDDGKFYAIGEDLTSPSCSVTSPAEGALVCGSEALVISGTVADNQGGSGVASVELCFDDECLTIWHEALLEGHGPSLNWSYTGSSFSDGPHTIRVRATDHRGNVQKPPTVRTCQVDLSGPRAFHLVLPADNTWQTKRPAFSWEATTDATSAMGHYEIFIWPADEGGNFVAEGNGSMAGRNGSWAVCSLDDVPPGDVFPVNTGLAPQYQPAVPLTRGTYRWTVRAFDECGNGVYAGQDTHDIRTLMVDTTQPEPPSLTSPADGSAICISHPVFCWQEAVDADSGIDHYELHIDGDVTGAEVQEITPAQTGQICYQAEGSMENGQFAWYVRAIDRAGQGRDSEIRRFTVELDIRPPGVVITSPGQNSYQGPLGFRLLGSCSDDPAGCPSGVAAVEVAEVSGDGIQQWIPARLSDDGQAWWIDCPVSTNGPITFTARAKDHAGNISHSEECPSLTVMGDITPPQPFALLSPAEGIFCPATPTFQWEAATDTGSFVARYILYFDDSNTTALEISLLPEVSFTPGAFSTPGTFSTPDTFFTPDTYFTPESSPAPAISFVSTNGSATSSIISYTLTDEQALTQGVYTWTVRAVDAVGLSTLSAAGRTVNVDSTAPSAPALISPADMAWSNRSEFTLKWSSAHDPYGEICGYWLVLDQGEPVFITVIPGLDYQTGLNYQTGVLAEGDHPWSVTATDCAGHQGPSSTLWTIRIDRTPPAAPALTWPENGAFVSTRRPTLRWSAPSDGPAGNPSRICRYHITITTGDTGDTAMEGDTAMGGYTAAGRHNAMGSSTFETTSETAFETTSDGTEYTPASDLSEGSIISWSVQALDCAENLGPTSAVSTFTIDTVPPQTFALPAEGSYKEPFAILLSMNEAGTIHYTKDGTQPTAISPVYTGPIEVLSDQEIFLRYAGIDRAGNKSTIKALHYILDTTAPVPDVAPLPGLRGACEIRVTTAPTATDNISGKVTGITDDPLIYTIPGIYTVTWTYDDGHGNTATQKQIITIASPWSKEAGMQQYSMNISGTAYDGLSPAAAGDWIGAFGPGGISDCRAVGRVEANGFYDLAVGCNQAAAHEVITFSLIRCPDEQILNCMETLLLVPGETIRARELTFGPCLQSIDFVKGWNWVSFNVFPYDTSLEAVFNGHMDSVRQIKAQAKSAINVPGLGWISDDFNLLSGISEGVMFKVEATADFTLRVVGTCISPDLPIAVQKGWTWIACLPDSCLPVGESTISVFEDLCQVKSRTRSRIQFPDGSFIGDLIQMCPGQGYTLKMNANGTLVYGSP